MLARLVWKLLPYLMVLGGLFFALSSASVIVGGAETEPTTVALTDVSANAPKARWLKLTGGGLYLPDAIVDEQIKKSTGARKTRAWYVPYVTESAAVDRAKSLVGGSTRPADKSVVLVRFEPDEFLRSYPTPDRIQTGDVFRAVEVQGTRTSNILFPQRLKDYVRSELQQPLDSIVVIKYGDKPLQRDAAVTMALVFGAVAAVGALWIVTRFRSRGGAVPPPPPPPPVPT